MIKRIIVLWKIRLSCPYLWSFWKIFDDNNDNDNDADNDVSNSSEDNSNQT